MSDKKGSRFYILICIALIACLNFYSFTTIKLSTVEFFDACNDVNWATWHSFNGNSAVGTINNSGDIVNVKMTSNFNFGSTPQIYNHSKFSSYPATIPNATVPQTTWSKGTGGTTTICFSKTVTNPVLLIASLGASLPISSTLSFSKPYVVLFDGGNMQFHNSTSLTGTEGYAIIMFPGDFDCVTINSTTEEFYTNITWGIRPPPFNISISETKTCGNVQLTASGGVSYLWNGGSNPTSATNNFTTSGTYIVTVTNSTGCKTSASKEVTIDNFNPTITGSISGCTNVTLAVSGGKSYLWDGGETPTGATNTFTESGNYTVQIIFEGGCTSTLTRAVKILGTTNNIISTPITKFCNGKANIIIDGTTPVGAANVTSVFLWQQSLNGIDWVDINNSNIEDYRPTEFTQTTYFRRVTQSESCNSNSNVIKIEINPTVTTANAGADKSLCNTSTLQLDANSVSEDETGAWSVISPTTFNPFTALNINAPKAIINNIPENEEVILKWTIIQNDCLTESSAQVKIFNYGIPAFSMPTNFTINEGQTLAIPAILTPNPNTTYTYQWSPALYLDDPTKLAPNASPLETSIYHLNISYGSCLLEKEIKIIINKAIRLDVCPSTAITLAGAVDNDVLSVYQWQKLTNGIWTDIQNANKFDLSIPTPENFTNSIYQVEYRRVVLNSPYYDSRYLLAISTRTDNNIIKTNQTVYCATSVDNLLIAGSTPIGANNTTITFTWQQSDDGNTWNDLPIASKNLTISTLTKTTYFKRITHADACETESNILKVQINLPATIADAGENISYCGSTTVTLNANEIGANETGSWKVISPVGYNPFDSQSIHSPKAIISNLPLNQPVDLQWTIEKHNCNTSSSSEITLISYEDIIINAPKALTIDLGKKINLGVTANLSTLVNYTLEWSPSLGLDQNNILSPNASPIDNTTYGLKISYGDNCLKTVFIKVVVLKNIEVPNSFSPNGDGINDNWEIKNLANYPGSKVFIYNRYGAPIFESNSYSIPWDGRHKGKKLPTGTFYYIIILKDGENSVYKGSLTILN